MKNAIKSYEVKGVSLFGASLASLISGVQENSVRMPSGMSREQRRKWAAEQVRTMNQEAQVAQA